MLIILGKIPRNVLFHKEGIQKMKPHQFAAEKIICLTIISDELLYSVFITAEKILLVKKSPGRMCRKD